MEVTQLGQGTLVARRSTMQQGGNVLRAFDYTIACELN